MRLCLELRPGGNQDFTRRSVANAPNHVVEPDTPRDEPGWPSAAWDTCGWGAGALPSQGPFAHRPSPVWSAGQQLAGPDSTA